MAWLTPSAAAALQTQLPVLSDPCLALSGPEHRRRLTRPQQFTYIPVTLASMPKRVCVTSRTNWGPLHTELLCTRHCVRVSTCRGQQHRLRTESSTRVWQLQQPEGSPLLSAPLPMELAQVTQSRGSLSFVFKAHASNLCFSSSFSAFLLKDSCHGNYTPGEHSYQAPASVLLL